MKLGILSFFSFVIFLFFLGIFHLYADDKIESVPLINLEELSPTFEEDKDELEKIENKNVNMIENTNVSNEKKIEKNNKVYVNLTALDKITAKTSSIQLAVGEKKYFGQLEIKALKCEFSKSDDFLIQLLICRSGIYLTKIIIKFFCLMVGHLFLAQL